MSYAPAKTDLMWAGLVSKPRRRKDMTRIHVIGDLHGDFVRYAEIMREANDLGVDTLQLGDLGVGFPPESYDHPSFSSDFSESRKESYSVLDFTRIPHWFIPGNHDNPDVCRKMQRNTPCDVCPSVLEDVYCLGRYGHIRSLLNAGIKAFFVGGGTSLDRNRRIEGVNWWRGEELSYAEATEAYNEYMNFRPDIVFSHTAPTSIVEMIVAKDYTSATENLLQAMLDAFAPKAWYFAHFHKSYWLKPKDTVFCGLDTGEVKTVSIEPRKRV